MKLHFLLGLILLTSDLIGAEAPKASSEIRPAPAASPSLNSGQNLAEQGKKVPGSQVLSTTFTIKQGSAAQVLVNNLLNLEKDVQNINQAKGPESKKLETRIRSIVSAMLDLESLGKGALATHWSQFSKPKMPTLKDRAKYMALFKELVEENYLEKARAYVGGKYQIVLTEEMAMSGTTIVLGHIKKTDVDMELEFQMEKMQGIWRVKDIKLDQTSLETTYRSGFNSIIKKKDGFKNGFPEIMKAMDKRLKELRKGGATKI